MNDKSLMEDMLTSSKALSDLYLHGTIESSTPEVHETFDKALKKVLEMQKEITAKMQERGWYNVSNADATKIQQVNQKFASQSQV